MRTKANKVTILTNISYSIFIPILTFVLLQLVDYDLTHYGAVFFSSAILFSLPLIRTMLLFYKKKITNLWYSTAIDFLTILLPAIFVSLLADLFNAIFYGLTEFTGIITMILSLIYIIIYASSLLVCFIILKCKKL